MFDIEIYVAKHLISEMIEAIKPFLKGEKILSDPIINDDVICFTDSITLKELNLFIKFIRHIKLFDEFKESDIVLTSRDLSKPVMRYGSIMRYNFYNGLGYTKDNVYTFSKSLTTHLDIL